MKKCLDFVFLKPQFVISRKVLGCIKMLSVLGRASCGIRISFALNDALILVGHMLVIQSLTAKIEIQ